MTIKVLGSGCPTCKKLYEMTKQAIKELNWSDEVEYITDIDQIIDLGLMTSPVLMADDQVLLAGKISDVSGIKELLKDIKK
jgi:small redox-active disulfide protein 2